jgi:hypothetical protein
MVGLEIDELQEISVRAATVEKEAQNIKYT